MPPGFSDLPKALSALCYHFTGWVSLTSNQTFSQFFTKFQVQLHKDIIPLLAYRCRLERCAYLNPIASGDFLATVLASLMLTRLVIKKVAAM